MAAVAAPPTLGLLEEKSISWDSVNRQNHRAPGESHKHQ